VKPEEKSCVRPSGIITSSAPGLWSWSRHTEVLAPAPGSRAN
jgi:hypothetical protein